MNVQTQTRAPRLARDAAEAAEVRAYQTDPDVVALRIERVRRQVDLMCWSGIVLGLAFTMTTVQTFASAGTLPWLAAWVTLAATYVMNTWASFADGAPAAIVLHSVPPLVVFVAVEAITDLQDKLTDAVGVAHRTAEERAVHGETVNAGVHETDRRKLFADYLAVARANWSPGVEVTPAWIRQVAGCSRGLSPRLARALIAEVADERE
jgi:hypothetical protein